VQDISAGGFAGFVQVGFAGLTIGAGLVALYHLHSGTMQVASVLESPQFL
jgi:hypothetical protein